MSQDERLDALVDFLEPRRRLFVLTGAGCSTESGIPDYRDADGAWNESEVLTGEVIREVLEDAFGPLAPIERDNPSQPAVDYRFVDGRGQIGFINPVSQPFCSDCNRLRLTAEGQVRNCLFSNVEWDVRALLRGEATDDELRRLVRDCVAAKKPAHGIGEADFKKPTRAMYQIGG